MTDNTALSASVTVETLPVVAFQNVRVLTTDLLAQRDGTDPKNIRMNHANNADRFEHGKHFFKLEGEARREFKKLYDAGDYARAQAALRPVLADCGASMPWLEAGWIRNDLALTQFKLGDPQGCLLTLQPLRADAARSDSDIRAAYPPSDADRYLSILRATRSNAGRCEAAPAL